MTTTALPAFLDGQHLIESFGLAGLFLIIFAETGLLLGFFLPGDSLLFAAGFAATGKLAHNLHPNIVLVCALASIVAIAGAQTGYLIGGLLVIEKLFNYNGIGQRIYVAATNKDFALLQSGVLIIGMVYLSATLIADLLYSLLNPRIRFGSAE